MREAASNPILRAIRQMVGDQRLAELTDQELLQRFLYRHDETAFQAILRRHGPMVLGVCRAVAANEADAEDAFQATFLVFARSARDIRKMVSLASWLHGVAYRTALKQKARFALRQKHEARAGKPEATAPDDLMWGDVHDAVHEELNRLSERHRAPLVLCYLQGKTHDEAAAQLKLAKGTLKGRLTRGRALLRARLVRRGLDPEATPVATVLPPALMAAVLNAGSLSAASVTAPRIAVLADAVLRMMFLARLKTGAILMLVACGFGLGGGIVASRSLVVLPPLLPQEARAVVELPPPDRQAQQPAPPRPDEPAMEAGRFAQLLQEHPARRIPTEDQLGLFLMDLDNARTTLVAAQVDHERAYCGSPCWSADGRHIVFDASPGFNQWEQTRLIMLGEADQGLVFSDLGLGNCPTLSPDEKQIAYLVNPGSPAVGTRSGIHVMNADGTGRRWLGGHGVPKWSPDGRHLLVVSFSTVRRLSLIDVATGEEQEIQLPEHQFYSVPSWTGPDTLVTVVSSSQGGAIVLLDVSKPAQAKIQETLWRRDKRLNVGPGYPVYSPAARRGAFVGADQSGQALFTLEPGQLPRRLEPARSDGKIASLAASPDGRYLLFCSDRR